MTIPISYATLQTAVAEYREQVGVTAFTDLIPTFIALCENKLNRVAPVRLSRVNTTLTATPSSRNIALPADFVEGLGLFRTTDGNETELAKVSGGLHELSTTNGTPRIWGINAGNIELDCPADSAHTFRFYYRKKLFDLATTDPNWLLTNHPDVYLYGTLAEAAGYEMDDAAVAKYRALYQ